ncbi:hypothetical protein [Sporomusa aerivorans]|uniref:hypothetical protein n=1 Tax=Sporomusa aerivorans TaxID=204936 RepID=UPI00352B85C0
MKFTYELADSGWADVYWELDGKVQYFFVSYISDALGDFLNCLVNLLPQSQPKKFFKNSFLWHAEPSGYNWTIELFGDSNIRVKIESVTDAFDPSSDRKVEMDLVCNLDQFLEMIVESVEVLLSKHGFIGYKETWVNHDFPISAYLKLKYYCLTKDNYPIQEKSNAPFGDYYISDFQHEMNLFVTDLKP